MQDVSVIRREVVRAWRRLALGTAARDTSRPTVAACSGGCDSSALAFALGRHLRAIAHVRHDLRAPALVERDAASARALAERLGVEYLERSIRTDPEAGNLEAQARSARHVALASMAVEAGCRFVALGHHADDQVETVLMHLLRGSGVRGLGMPESRPLGEATIIRPMLSITREACEAICADEGWEWVEDETNRDLSRRRAAIRAIVLPALREADPEMASRISRSSSRIRSIAPLLDEGALALEKASLVPSDDGSLAYALDLLGSSPDVVVGEMIRRGYRGLREGRGMDSLSGRQIDDVVEAIRSGDEATFQWAGVEVTLSRARLHLRRTT